MANEEQDKQRKEEPIIIKKVKGHGGHGHHGGSWKVAYADFVTAMMAFFIVMWILGQSEEVKQQVVAYFEDPGAFSFVTGKRTIPIDLELKPSGKGDGEYDREGEGENVPWFVFDQKSKDTIINEAAKQLKEIAMQDSAEAAKRVEAIGDKLKKMFKKEMLEKPELKEILSSIKIQITKEGLRIELIESKQALFFEVGSANLSQKAKEVLRELGMEIGKLPNTVDLEGHTDSRQYGSGSVYSNWDLSTDRANSARRYLSNNGLWDGQVTKVIGYADRNLQNPNNPFDISNRRISILIRQLKVDDFLQNQAETADYEQ
jgi:chemotaxis protein MotB